MAEEKDIYVKMGRRGLIEREAFTPADRVQLEGTGWVRKDSRLAPTGKPAGDSGEGDSTAAATSVTAHANAADSGDGKAASAKPASGKTARS